MRDEGDAAIGGAIAEYAGEDGKMGPGIWTDEIRLRRRIDETERLEALREYAMLDTAREQRYDKLAEMLRVGCSAAWSTITFVDSERQWFKATHGCDLSETPRSVSFCSVSMLQNDPLIVQDARLDPRFCNSPTVVGEPFVRFYAGYPIFSRAGFGLGSVCVNDTKPRVLLPDELELIRKGRDWVQANLESRRMALSFEVVSGRRGNEFEKERRYHELLEARRWNAVMDAFNAPPSLRSKN